MRMRGRFGLLVVLCAALGWARSAAADITTEKSASILVWPKIIADGTRDTVIQLTNTSNGLVRAHCFYVNAALTNPDLPPGPLNPPLWIEVDFTVRLTKQQPTHWTVSQGRIVNPTDPPCNPENDFCPDAGIDPGHIPPVVPDFVGELKCVEVDDSGAPVSGNHLLGAATIIGFQEQRGEPNVLQVLNSYSKYSAIGILGDENNGDNVLVLGGGQCSGSGAVCQSDDDCGDEGPCAFEYNACPQTWILNHLADGAPNLVLEDTPAETFSSPATDTELTIVPCTQNFETQIPTTVTLQFLTFNEFESQFSVSTSVTCWGNFRLGDMGAPAMTFAGQLFPDPQGTMYLQTRIRPAAGTPFGVLMVEEEFQAGPLTSSPPFLVVAVTTDAGNLHMEGERSTPDLITIPADQLQP